MAGTTSHNEPDPKLKQGGGVIGPSLRPDGDAAGQRPHWDTDSRELWFLGCVIIRLRHSAVNLEIVLLSWEEDEWIRHLDDPLPVKNLTLKQRHQRLRDVVRHLNEGQINHLIHFSMDGTGTGIRWKPLHS